jgi:hypothetical protein
MSAYRLGSITVQDKQAGTLVLEGDGYAAAGEINTLLVNPGVAAFLGMSQDEQNAARALVDTYRRALQQLYSTGEWKPPSLDPGARSARAELAAGVERLFGPERAARLKQLSWRLRGGDALLDEEVASRLQLTDAERAAIAEAATRAEEENQRALKSISHVRQGRLASPQPLEESGRDASRVADERLLVLLTPEQRERFEEMKRGTP